MAAATIFDSANKHFPQRRRFWTAQDARALAPSFCQQSLLSFPCITTLGVSKCFLSG